MCKWMPSLKAPQDIALYCTLRRALRNAPDFVSGHECVVLLNVPPDRAAEDYDTCAESFVRRFAAERDDMAYIFIAATDKPRAIITRLEQHCNRKRRLLIFREQGAEIPIELSLSVDVEVDLAPISPMDFRIGCRLGFQIDVAEKEAEEALTHPLQHVWAALRRGRPIKYALTRLALVSKQKSSSQGKQPLPPLQDMFGYGAAKDWGLELARDLMDWRKGKIAWSEVDTGIVLSGPPGVGKTQFAAALARQCELPIIAASLGQWQANGHLGDLLKAMRADFGRAKAQTPAILFVDELDSFGDRNSFSDDNKDYSTQVVNAFLEHLDGLDGREGVVVIGATNNASRIDPAILRPGRLDRHVAIDLPDAKDRLEILQQHLGQKLPRKHHLKLATATNGFSGADLAKVARDAKRSARRAGRDIAFADVVRALPPLVPITGELRRSIAIHEAGHVVAVVVLKLAQLKGAMIVDHTRDDGVTSPGGGVYYDLPSVAYRTAKTYRDQIVVHLAGRAAEEVCLGAVGDGSGAGRTSDLAQATRLATLLQTYMGMGNRLRHSLAIKDVELENLRNADPAVGAWVEEVLQTEYVRAKQLLRDNRLLLEQIANALEATGKITAGEVQKMMVNLQRAAPRVTAA